MTDLLHDKPLTDLIDWVAREDGLDCWFFHAEHRNRCIVPYGELAKLHPGLPVVAKQLSNYHTTTTTKKIEGDVLMCQLQHLRRPTPIPRESLDPQRQPIGAPPEAWLNHVSSLSYTEKLSCVLLGAHVYGLVPTTDNAPALVSCTYSTVLFATKKWLDTIAPGWHDRFLVASTIGCTPGELADHVFSTQDMPTGASCNLNGLTLD